MVENETVCCMCGDVGFSDKLFHCNKCRNRFQHSYCSNYCGEYSEPIEVCDWCRWEEKSSPRQGTSSKKSLTRNGNGTTIAKRPEYSVGKIIQQNNNRQNRPVIITGNKGKTNSSGAPSPRTAARRYKLLKDVMC